MAKLKLKRSKAEDVEEVEEESKPVDENLELREMMISRNKKRLLSRIREEKGKKKRNGKPNTGPI